MGEDCITQEILDLPLVLDLNLINVARMKTSHHFQVG